MPRRENLKKAKEMRVRGGAIEMRIKDAAKNMRGRRTEGDENKNRRKS